MTALAEQFPQLGQQAARMRISLGVGIDGLPEQSHEPVTAPLGAEADPDQVTGQLTPVRDVLRAEQAMMSEA